MELARHIGRRLRALREQRGWTQAELADLTGKAVETISNMERGKSMPGLRTLEQFAKCFGVGLEDLVRSSNGEKEVFAPDPTVVAAAVKRLPEPELSLVAGIISMLERQRRRARRPSPRNGA